MKKMILTVSLFAMALISTSGLAADKPDAVKPVTAYKNVAWSDDFVAARKKLNFIGVQGETGSFDPVKMITAAAMDKGIEICPDKENSLSQKFGGLTYNLENKLSTVELNYIFERKPPGKDEAVKTILWEVEVYFDDDVNMAAVRDKLAGTYGPPERVEDTSVSVPVYLKRLEMKVINLGYLGFKFIIPIKKYHFKRRGISLVLEVPQYGGTYVVDSTEKETKTKNSEIRTHLIDNAKSHVAMRAVRQATAEASIRTRPLCDNIARHLREGKALPPKLAAVEREMLDIPLHFPKRLIKTNTLVTEKILAQISDKTPAHDDDGDDTTVKTDKLPDF